MPINGVLDLQRRNAPLGELRMGTSVEVPGKNYRRPVRLETWRFTTGSEQTAHVIAAKYGGEVVPWPRKKGYWEVVTKRTAIDVWVPPRGEAVDANMELWDGPKRLRKCDGITESLSGKPCWCPHPDDPSDPASVQRARDERKRLAGLRPPQACKPLTRISVTIPDLPGLTGVFRLNTGSENAAVETADSGDAMAIAREGGVYLPAVLRIEWRIRSADGKPYPVPVLQIGLSMRDLAEHALPAGPSGLLTQLGRAPAEERLALPAGAAAEPAPPADAGPEIEPQDWQRAQRIYERALAATSGSALTACAHDAEAAGLLDEHVCTDSQADVWEPLHDALQGIWREKAREAS
jgi:hypothetical protein